MIRINIIVLLTILVAFGTQAQTHEDLLSAERNSRYSKAVVIKEIMRRYTKDGIPGVSLAVYTEKEGWWAAASGMADLQRKEDMKTSHLQYMQSVSKTYMAVAILKLKEEGKLNLDDEISRHLSKKYTRYINDAKKITIRMLLNHTSGLPEYSTQPGFVSSVILHPGSPFSFTDCLQSIKEENLLFKPGTKFSYSNTNYLLLSLIADKLTGDHAKYIQKKIFEPLGLRNSFYENNHNYLKKLPLVNSYWDVLGVGRPADITSMQQVNVSSLKGDDGIVCTPMDAVHFFKELMEGRLLSEASLKEMLSFVKDEKGNKKYGMGIYYYNLGGIIGYGHGGAGIGAGCILLYVPVIKTYLFLSTNIGVLVENSLSKKVDSLRNELFAVIAR